MIDVMEDYLQEANIYAPEVTERAERKRTLLTHRYSTVPSVNSGS
jgi:hypothetical protein